MLPCSVLAHSGGKLRIYKEYDTIRSSEEPAKGPLVLLVTSAGSSSFAFI